MNVGAVDAGSVNVGAVGVSLPLVFAGAALAAFLVCLDLPFKSKIPQPTLVFKTREWWLLWFFNGIVASGLIYVAAAAGKINLLTFLGFIGVILGYPAILKMRLFTFRADNPIDEKSMGPQIVLDLAEAFLLPGITDSIEERTSDLIDQYVDLGQKLNTSGQAENFRKISEMSKNYIGGISGIKASEKDAATKYVDELIADTRSTPTNAGSNARALFFKVQNLGGFRGVRWVLAKAKKKGLD